MVKEKFKRFCGFQIDYELFGKVLEAKRLNTREEIKNNLKIKTTYGIDSIRRG